MGRNAEPLHVEDEGQDEPHGHAAQATLVTVQATVKRKVQ